MASTCQILTHERVESLRAILECEYGRPVSKDEAAEIGHSMINFFDRLVLSPANANSFLLLKNKVK